MRRIALMLVTIGLVGCGNHRYPDGRGIQGQLEREIQALRLKNEQLEAQAKNCGDGAEADRMYGILKQILTDPDIPVSSKGVITVVTIPDRVLWGSDGWSVREEAYQSLDLLASALKDNVAYEVIIVGHTADTHGDPNLGRMYPSLLDLSYARAKGVRDLLVVNLRIPEDRVTVVAAGPYLPMASNDTTAGQQQNRRVEIRLLPPGYKEF